jgi:colicin import membrane protein
LSIAVHALFFVALLISNFLDSPQVIRVSGNNVEQQDKPIIQAGLINHEAIKDAINRQQQQESDRQQKLAQQRAKSEKLRREAEIAKLEAQKLKQKVAVEKKKAEEEKRQALVEKEEAEKAKLQATKEKEKARLVKEQAAQKLEKIKQEKLKAAKEKELARQAQEKAALERKHALEEKERQKAEQTRKTQELALQQQADAERNNWLDSEFIRYVGEIKHRIIENRTISAAFPPDLICEIQIKLLPDGSVYDVRIIKSSGNVAYDSISEAAVYKAAPFNMPEDKELVSRLRDSNIVWIFVAGENGNV